VTTGLIALKLFEGVDDTEEQGKILQGINVLSMVD
jgi:hypothetical protein